VPRALFPTNQPRFLPACHPHYADGRMDATRGMPVGGAAARPAANLVPPTCRPPPAL